ncbi:MAG: Patatin [Tardiphaga sp.]|nr:Patatin [Tardiphaga sp.]
MRQPGRHRLPPATAEGTRCRAPTATQRNNPANKRQTLGARVTCRMETHACTALLGWPSLSQRCPAAAIDVDRPLGHENATSTSKTYGSVIRRAAGNLMARSTLLAHLRNCLSCGVRFAATSAPGIDRSRPCPRHSTRKDFRRRRVSSLRPIENGHDPTHDPRTVRGGADGSYGAGFLKGWSASGLRPDFDIVTGSSVGSLIAPFAFLGPDYDSDLEAIFTSGVAEDLLHVAGISAVSWDPASLSQGQ